MHCTIIAIRKMRSHVAHNHLLQRMNAAALKSKMKVFAKKCFQTAQSDQHCTKGTTGTRKYKLSTPANMCGKPLLVKELRHITHMAVYKVVILSTRRHSHNTKASIHTHANGAKKQTQMTSRSHVHPHLHLHHNGNRLQSTTHVLHKS
jgi:hypothetical protein